MRIFKQLFSKTEKCKYIEYSYGDSSVPPEYHRSFVVHITKEKITIKVDSYGDIINDKSFKLSDKDFKDIELIREYQRDNTITSKPLS